MMGREVAVLPTMDCEPPRSELPPHAREMSVSGPEDEEESRQSIRGFVDVAARHGFTPTLFLHPEVAENQREFLLGLEERGVCLGLHLHPYKLDQRYDHDLGWYAEPEQREILEEAARRWEEALGRPPRYFRGGKFSANDSTFRILRELGFEGGSVSSPGRVLPNAASVWAGAEPYPHRVHEGFRHLAGESEFVDVPGLGDATRPLRDFDRWPLHDGGAADQTGYETLYVPTQEFDHRAVVANLLARFQRDRPDHPSFVLITHNDVDYRDSELSATVNYETIFDTIADRCEEVELEPVDATVGTVVDDVRASE